MPAISLREIIEEAYQANPSIIDCAACDIQAVRHRDPAVELWSTPLLYLKRFHAIQSYQMPIIYGIKTVNPLPFIYKTKISVNFRCRYSSCSENWSRHHGRPCNRYCCRGNICN